MSANSQAILIIEDSDDDFEATVRALKKAKLANPIVRAKGGREALDVIKTLNPLPGLILLDLNMPGMDGRAVLAHLKAATPMRKIPIVVLTTSGDERDIEDCYLLGANTFMQKPVDLDGFFAAIQRLTEYWFEIALLPVGD